MDDATLRDVIEEQLERYPDLEAVDLYKTLHEIARGQGGRVESPALAREALIEQALAVDVTDAWQEPVEVIDPTRGLARVHLRPYLRAGGSIERLHEAYVRSAERCVDADGQRLALLLAAAQGVLAGLSLDEVSWDLDAFRRVLGQAAKDGYRPPPHSKTFREEYEPAYRVVLLDELDG